MCNYIPQDIFDSAANSPQAHLIAIADGAENILRRYGIKVDCRDIALNDVVCQNLAEKLARYGDISLSNQIQSRIHGIVWGTWILGDLNGAEYV